MMARKTRMKLAINQRCEYWSQCSFSSLTRPIRPAEEIYNAKPSTSPGVEKIHNAKPRVRTSEQRRRCPQGAQLSFPLFGGQ
jgi:hypothetical protein